MAILLVTYNMNKPSQDYTEFHRVIKKYPWKKLSESSYALDTTEFTVSLFNQLRPLQDKSDHLYVVALRRPYAGFGPSDVNDWLKQRLPY